MVTHDRYFLDKVTNKIFAFENGHVREFFGNYTDYLDEKAFEENAVAEQAKKAFSQKTEKEKNDADTMELIMYYQDDIAADMFDIDNEGFLIFNPK